MKKLQDGEREINEVGFDSNIEIVKQDYLNIFEAVKSDVMYTTQYDENSDVGTTYMGMPKMRRQDKLKAEQKAPITEDCYIPGKLLDGIDCNILLEMRASKSFMSHSFDLNCTSVHSVP